MINVLQLVKEYRGNHHLFNELFPLDPAKYRVTVCYLTGKNNGNNLLENTVDEVIYLDLKETSLKWYNLAPANKIKKIIDGKNIDIINCHRHRATLIGVVAATMSKKSPSVFSTIHGFERKSTIRRKVIDYFFNRRLEGLILVSEALRQYVLMNNWALVSTKLHTVYNGSSFSRFINSGEKQLIRKTLFSSIPDGFWFGTAGRLVPVKNHEGLIHAFNRVARQMANCHLLIAGSGPLEKYLKGLVDELGLASKVHFLGYRTDIPEVLKTLDAFVLPSRREGLPMALLEAMASGLPVVGSRVGGIPEILQGCGAGMLVTPMDSDDLAVKMLEMAKMPSEQLHTIGILAKQRAVEGFSARAMIDGYDKIFRSTLDKHLAA